MMLVMLRPGQLALAFHPPVPDKLAQPPKVENVAKMMTLLHRLDHGVADHARPFLPIARTMPEDEIVEMILGYRAEPSSIDDPKQFVFVSQASPHIA
jgi:hypothetical protein